MIGAEQIRQAHCGGGFHRPNRQRAGWLCRSAYCGHGVVVRAEQFSGVLQQDLARGRQAQLAATYKQASIQLGFQFLDVRLTFDCTVWHCVAARAKLPVSAIAVKSRRGFCSIVRSLSMIFRIEINRFQ